MTGKDYYKILGVGRNATDKELKQVYRRLARKYHPDVNANDKSAEAKFKEVNEAYEVLSDSEKRKKYDRFGDQWQHAEEFTGARQGTRRSYTKGGTYTNSDFGDMGDLSSIFEGMFGNTRTGTRTSRRSAVAKGVEHPIEVTLEEAFHGTNRVVQVWGEESCTVCGGSGKIRDGIRNKPCTACGGYGRGMKPKRLEVKVPQGVRDGSKVRIAGQGGSGPGGIKSDLFLIVKVLPHKVFERKGDDLHSEVSVPLLTVVLGGEIELPTLKGKIALKIPPETQNGKVFHLTNQGMPRLGDHKSHGDLYAKIKVLLPTKLTEDEKQIFEQLRALRHD